MDKEADYREKVDALARMMPLARFDLLWEARSRGGRVHETMTEDEKLALRKAAWAHPLGCVCFLVPFTAAWELAKSQALASVGAG